MKCLKCGKETKEQAVFCRHCLDSMAAYPVKADVHIHLPRRDMPVPPKKAGRKHRTYSPEEQVARLTTRLRYLFILVLLLILMLSVTVAMLLHATSEKPESNLGKNYTFDSTVE